MYNKPKLVMGFDYGTKRIGVATGQTVTNSASTLTTIAVNNGNPDWGAINKLVNEWQPDALIVGYPTMINGKRQAITGLVDQFIDALKDKFSKPVFAVDERLSTQSSRSAIFASQGYKGLRKTAIDEVAAATIVEQWLLEQSRK